MDLLAAYLRFYAFALSLGVRNLLRHGFALGPKRTLGKVLQPINAISRYPEYTLCLRALAPALAPPAGPALLDVGSPKPFGLFLAARHGVRAVLSDINQENFSEYLLLSQGMPAAARDRVRFEAIDGRAIPHPDASFDLVVSMSVVEHIHGEGGDHAALEEMWRVLKPGGTLVVSVPFGSRRVAQERPGFTYLAGSDADGGGGLFQRIYDEASLREMIPAGWPAPRRVFVHRARPALLHAYLRLGLTARGLLGGLSPLLATLLMRTAPEFDEAARRIERYGTISRNDDIYSDVVLHWER